MKLHYGALIILGVATLGIVLLSVTPIISGVTSVGSITIKRTFFGFGNGKIVTTIGGSTITDTLEVPDDFPLYVPILITIGFILAIAAGIIFLLIENKKARDIAILLGIVGGGLALIGILTFIPWGQEFLEGKSGGFFHVGFFATILASTAIIVLSIVYIFTKPKRKKSVVF